MEAPGKPYLDTIKTWDDISQGMRQQGRTGAFYHERLNYYYQFMIPPGLKVLELGCGHGDLLASLNPRTGVGVDFSSDMLKRAREKYPQLVFVEADAQHLCFNEKFDVIILSDLINFLWDVQAAFERLQPLCHHRTRIVLNFFNNMWQIPIVISRRFGLTINAPEQNWLAPEDVTNLLYLSGFEAIKFEARILLPVNWGFLATIANRLLVKLWPFRWFSITNFLIARPQPIVCPDFIQQQRPSVSIIIPARNEAGNIKALLERTSLKEYKTELIFVEGHSDDNTYEVIEREIQRFPDQTCRLLKQPGKGKADAVRAGCRAATGDILIILDADLTTPPEDLPRFVDALVAGTGEFINGVRLVYPVEGQSMRFLNMVANKLFGIWFSWVIGQSVKDTLCGTKALWKNDYDVMEQNRLFPESVDPFGDFDLLLGAAWLNLKVVDMPVRYRRRVYGDTNIKRWKHGWILLKMAILATFQFKLK